MTAPAPTALFKTRCKLCGEDFESRPFIALLDHSQPEPRRMKMGQVLGQHIMTKHMGQVQGMMFALCFQFEDPVLLDELNGARWSAHQMTAKNYVTDEAIREQFSKIGFDEEQIKAVIQFRDLLTETGTNSPMPQEPVSPLAV